MAQRLPNLIYIMQHNILMSSEGVKGMKKTLHALPGRPKRPLSCHAIATMLVSTINF